MIARYCVNERGRGLIRGLEPSSDGDVIAESLALAEELRRFMDDDGDVSIASTDYAAEVERIRRGESDMATEIYLRIASGERAVRATRDALSGNEAFPRLSAIAETLIAHGELVKLIDRTVESDGSIKDNASPALRQIRRDVFRLRESVRRQAESLRTQMGEETLATVMGSRHVLVVPRGRVRRDGGLVHAASHSGESLYFEPLKLVEANNDLETRIGDERAEVARIVSELAAAVRVNADALVQNADIIDRLDSVRARARFGAAFDCNSPARADAGRLQLVSARHPVLAELLSRDGRQGLIPLDLALDADRRMMVISGPNAGGKTVALKTAGVCCLMYQCGLQVPCAEGSELPVFARVFVDIGDEQSMESSLSTFTSHLRHLDAMSRDADERTLCLIDEIGDGTDPDEGAALAIATLERLLASGASVVATTHFGRIKTFALETAGIHNASMAFEDQEGIPLYRLLQGVAGRSRGLETARRHGFLDDVVARAEHLVGPDARHLEDVLNRLEATHIALEGEREAMERTRRELERKIDTYREKSAEYEMTREQALARARAEAETMLVQARRDIENIVKTLRQNQADRQTIRNAHEQIREKLDDVRAARPAGPIARAPAVNVGDPVSVSPQGSPVGIVRELDNGTATVDIGGKRIRIAVERLFMPAEGEKPAAASVKISTAGLDSDVEPLTSSTLDVRGHDREAAIAALNSFVDRAVMAGVLEVKIIHGIGEGILARAVKETMRDDPRVASLEPGGPGDGGMGVTRIRFK